MAQAPTLSANDQLKQVKTAVKSVSSGFNQIVKQSQVTLNWEREVVFALEVMKKNSALLKATPASIKSSVLNIASCGLSLNPALQYVTIVPRWNKSLKANEASIMFMYRGLVKLVTDGEKVLAVEVENVYENDTFDYTRGTEQVLTHVPTVFGDRGDFRGTYVMAYVVGMERPIITFVGADDIFKARDKSDSYKDNNGKVRNSSPWVQWFDEMAKKVALKRACKTLPRGDSGADIRLAEAIQKDHDDDRIEPDAERDLESTAIALINEVQGKEINAECRRLGVKAKVLYEAFDIKKLGDLPAAEYGSVIERFKAREEAMIKAGTVSEEDAKYIGEAG